MFHGLIENIKMLHPEALKRALIEFVEGYRDIEKSVEALERQIKENRLTERNDAVRISYENLLYECVSKIDGKIELFEEFEAQLENGMYEPIGVTENVIDVMLLDYKNRLNEALSETLKMYYGIKIDTLNELKKYL